MKKEYNKGITLIALVITIIILLILAGISIGMLVGENGLLTKAKQAQEETKKAQYKEIIQTIIIEVQMKVLQNEADQKPFIEVLKEEIEEQGKAWVEIVTMYDDEWNDDVEPENGTKLVVDTKDGYEIIVDVDNALIRAEIEEPITKKTKEKCTIEFELNGGTGEIDKKLEVQKGATIQLPTGEKINKPGYKFIGWKEKDGETIQGNKYKVKENTKLYAVWSDGTVSVTLKANGGNGQDVVKNILENVETQIDNPFVRDGYNFVGWSTTQDGEIEYGLDSKISLSESAILYARWEEKVTVLVTVTNEKGNTVYNITNGTQINVLVQSSTVEISKLKITVGEVEIYATNEEELGTNIQRTIKVDDMDNIQQIEFWNTYKITATATSKKGALTIGTRENILDCTIGSTRDIRKLSSQVKEGNAFKNYTIYLVSDISTGENWEPIGYWNGEVGSPLGKYFSGIFEGNQHTITIPSITQDTTIYKSNGLFGNIQNAVIQNLNIQGNLVNKDCGYIGGISGISHNSIVKDCINRANITGYFGAGGIVGTADGRADVLIIVKIQVRSV